MFGKLKSAYLFNNAWKVKITFLDPNLGKSNLVNNYSMVQTLQT